MIFNVGGSLCKMSSYDLHEFASAQTQNLYSYRYTSHRTGSALCQLSVTLMHVQCVSAELTPGFMLCSVLPLIMSAEAKLRCRN
jgi:hypothetical protein